MDRSKSRPASNRDGIWRERLEQGRAAFNVGQFFQAHELWEEAWHALAGADRILVQGLIQIAASLHHLQGGRRAPGRSLLTRGLEKLSRGASPLVIGGLPVDPLIHGVERLLSELADPEARPPDLSTLTF